MNLADRRAAVLSPPRYIVVLAAARIRGEDWPKATTDWDRRQAEALIREARSKPEYIST